MIRTKAQTKQLIEQFGRSLLNDTINRELQLPEIPLASSGLRHQHYQDDVELRPSQETFALAVITLGISFHFTDLAK